MIMASFKTTFVATFLLYFSYSVLIGCAQQYEYDYSAEARVSNWQSSRTSRTRTGDAPSRFDVKNSSPDLPVRNRPRSQSRYEGDGIARPQYETARQYTEEQTERAQIRGRQRTRQRIPDAGRSIERRMDDVTPATAVPSRRRSNRVRVTESTTQAPEQFTPRLRVPMEDVLVNQPRGFVASPRDGTGRSRQRVREETSTPQISTAASPRPFSRGRVKAKIYDTPRRASSSSSSSSSSSKADEVSESDNYPPGFIEKIKNSENRQAPQEDATPRRSRLRQRAAKTYPAIALSEANRFRPRYTRPTTSTEKPQTTTEIAEETPTKRNTLLDARQRNRSRYTTPRVTTDYAPKPFRNYSRRFSPTERNESSTTSYTTTISPKQKYLSRLRMTNRQFKPPKVIPEKIVEEKKEEALEPAENAFYTHSEDVTTEESKQKMKNLDVELEGDASEEDEQIETEKTTERPTTTTAATTITTAATTTSTATTTARAATSLPATRHRFSSRFSRSNKTSIPDDVARSTPASESLVLDSATSAPINLTSLFDDSPDSTLSIAALFNNSFNASSSVATNKTNSPETLTNTTTITTTTSTARPSTVTENSSTGSPSTTTKRATKKKSQKKSRKSNKAATTTASPLDGLNDRPILRNIVSLFGNAETTTKRSSGKRKSSRGRTTPRTATTTTTPGPRELEQIQSIINETMEVIHNRSGGPAPSRLVPRLALNALTPETSVEETTTLATATSRPANATTNTTTKSPSPTTAKTTTTTKNPSTTTAKTTTTTKSHSTTTAKTTTTTKNPSTTTAKTTTTTKSPSTTTAKTTTTTKNPSTTTAKTTTTTKSPSTTTAKTTTTTKSHSTTTAKTTTTTVTTTTARSTSSGKSAAISSETPKKNCTSQFVYFDYNSTAPIPQQFANFQQRGRAEATTSTTTTSTTADYFVYGVYPNNTIVRKRAWKTFDYEKYHSPYVIFGIYPNNTIVKKFPNGTVINDEFMTSDNEIRDVMGMPRRPTTTSTTTTTTRKPETITTTTKNPAKTTTTTTVKSTTTTTTTAKSTTTITTTAKSTTTTTTTAKPTTTTAAARTTTTKKSETTTLAEMRMAGSVTTENRIEEVTTEEESPDSMFEIIENEIEREERKDEELATGTTESATTTTVRDEDVFEERLPSTTTEMNVATTTEQLSRSAESKESTPASVSTTEGTTVASYTETTTRASTTETTPSVSTTETTESVAATTVQSSREGKSFSFNDIFSLDIVDSTTERVPTTTIGSKPRETTEPDTFARLADEVESRVPTTTGRTVSTTDSTERTTESYFDLQQIFQLTTVPDGPRSFDIDIRSGDGPVYRPFTTEASVEEGSTVARSLSDLEGDRFLSTTAEVPSNSRSISDLSENRLLESTTTESPTTSKSLFDLSEGDFFGSTTLRGPTTTRSVSGASDSNLVESTTTEVPTTTRSLFGLSEANLFGPTTPEVPTRSKSLFGLSEGDIFGSTTTETPTTSRPVSWSSSSTPAVSTTEVRTTLRSLFGSSENNLFESTTIDTPTTSRPVFRSSGSTPPLSTTTEVPTTLRSLFGLSENSLFGSTTTDTSPTTTRPVFRHIDFLEESTTTESPTTSRSLFGLPEGDLFGSTTTEATTTTSSTSSGSRLVESTTTETPTTLRPLSGLSETNLFGSTTTETPLSSEIPIFTSTVTERRNSEETTTTVSNAQNEIFLLGGDLFQLPEIESSATKSTVRDDEQPGLVNLAYRALGSSNTITTAPTPTTLKYITSTMKSTNYKEKKVRMKMKRTSTSTPKTEKLFIVTPETTVSDTEYGKKGKVKFVTLTPGVIVTTDVRDENDVITMSSQHVQKVTKAPANIPDNFLTSVVGEIQQKSSSPIPDILKNVEKELQGNGISVSLARRIIEMAIERAVTTEVPQTTGQIRETTFTAPYVTTMRTPITTRRTTTTVPITPTPHRIASTTSKEISTAYNDFVNTVNSNPLSVGFIGDLTESTTKKVNEEEINRLVQGLWKEQTQTTTIRTTTTTKSSKRTKSSRNPASSASTLSQNDKLLLEAILKQQNSNLSVQELDRIIENQIRLAEEVRKASKNMKKPRVTTTTTTTTTTQTPPLFGFLISLFSGNSSPSNIPVTRSPIKQTRSRLKSSRGPGSMSNNPKKPDPLKEAEVGNPSGERSTRGELVTAAIDVTKAVSKFMGTFLSSAAQSFQAFFSNFGRGR